MHCILLCIREGIYVICATTKTIAEIKQKRQILKYNYIINKSILFYRKYLQIAILFVTFVRFI